MAIVQISKIIHRIGANVDLPQLDAGEFGFSTDTRQLFIGNDPLLYPPPLDGVTHTEILTDQSSIDFARLNGSNSVSMQIQDPEAGQILGFGTSLGLPVITNLGGTAVSNDSVTRPKIDLGDVANIKISGASAFNGAVLQTDGYGNLSWVAQTGGSGGSSSTAAGSHTQVQFNDAGTFAGVSGFTFDKLTGDLSVSGNINVGTTLIGNVTGSVIGEIGNTIRNKGSFTTVVASSFSVTSTVNLTATSNVALGAVANVHITGGTTGQILSTDGHGNLSWTNKAVTGPLFMSYQSVGQSMPIKPSTVGNIELVFDTVQYDTNTCYDNTTGKFTPTQAGWYHIDAAMTAIADSLPTTGEFTLALYKNYDLITSGVVVSSSTSIGSLSSLVDKVSSVSTQVYLNGVADFIQMKLLYADTAVLWTTGSTLLPTSSYFQAAWIRN